MRARTPLSHSDSRLPEPVTGGVSAKASGATKGLPVVVENAHAFPEGRYKEALVTANADDGAR